MYTSLAIGKVWWTQYNIFVPPPKLGQSDWLMWQLSHLYWASLPQTTLLITPLQTSLAHPPIYWSPAADFKGLASSGFHSNRAIARPSFPLWRRIWEETTCILNHTEHYAEGLYLRHYVYTYTCTVQYRNSIEGVQVCHRIMATVATPPSW